MIDLHSHILPGIDDGAPDLDVSLEMARIAVASGVTVLACTPHILPGVFDNSGLRFDEPRRRCSEMAWRGGSRAVCLCATTRDSGERRAIRRARPRGRSTQEHRIWRAQSRNGNSLS